MNKDTEIQKLIADVLQIKEIYNRSKISYYGLDIKTLNTKMEDIHVIHIECEIDEAIEELEYALNFLKNYDLRRRKLKKLNEKNKKRMNKEDKDEIRGIINDMNIGMNTKVQAQNDLINIKLDGINNHLKTLNSKVLKHNESIAKMEIERAVDKEKHFNDQNNRYNTCPVVPEIDKIKKNTLTQEVIKKYNRKLLFTTVTILTLVFTALTFFVKYVF